MHHFLVGIDLGTTGIRSAILDENLEVLGEEYKEYPLITLSASKIEQDANEWWEITRDVVKASIMNSGADPARIRGISVSSQGIAIVPVDKECKPLRHAISWLDTRAVDETRLILEKFNMLDTYKKTGKRISETYTLPKIMWIKNNEPDVYNRTYKFLLPHDFIIAKLCGVFATDHTMASGTLAYDINAQEWWTGIIKTFGIEVEKLPCIKYSGTPVGTVLPGLAGEMGLPGDVIVSVGGQDQKCASLGAGISEDVLTVSLGTATAIEKIFDYPAVDNAMRIPAFSYLFKGKWVMEGVIGTSGICLKWFKNAFFKDKSYKELDNMAEETGSMPGSVFFYPFLSSSGSPGWYENPKGCFYGIDLSTGAAGIARSVLEGVAYQVKSNILVMEEAGKAAGEIRLVGGGASSNLWCRIMANVTGKRVSTLYTPETACVGAAILAGLGAGVFKNAEEALGKIRIKDVFECDKDLTALYRQKFEEYVCMQERIMK
ncbi:MAG: hypothetical protein GX754_09085 [Clostridiaceae bacterium]|nr:hypothetical protein [Clostridiaceae bacterium]